MSPGGASVCSPSRWITDSGCDLIASAAHSNQGVRQTAWNNARGSWQPDLESTVRPGNLAGLP